MRATNVVRLEIARCEAFAGGISFGNTGACERLLGTAHYAIDPDEDGLPYICDLDLASQNADGLVGRSPLHAGGPQGSPPTQK